MSESLLLHRLANAIDEKDAMLSYVNDLPAAEKFDFEAKVNWRWGSACPGYKEIERIVSKIVNESLEQLIRDALRKQEDLVLKLRRDVYGTDEHRV